MKQFKVKVSFSGLEIGQVLTNVNAEHEAELIEKGLIEEVKSDKKKDK